MLEQSVTIVGNLTAKPELRYAASGVPMVQCTIAQTPRRYDAATDSYVDGEPLFLRATVWDDLARHLADTAERGTQVIAVGRLRQYRFQTESGERRTNTELAVDHIGPSLRYVTATLTKPQRTGTTPPAGDAGATANGTSDAAAVPDPWSTRPAPTPDS